MRWLFVVLQFAKTNDAPHPNNEHKTSLRHDYGGNLEPVISAQLKMLLDDLEYQLDQKVWLLLSFQSMILPAFFS